MTRRAWTLSFVLSASLALVCLPTRSHAATVNLAVDANTEADWASDNFYRAPGTCLNPGAFAKVGTALKSTAGAAVTFTDSAVPDGQYCYAATAVDTVGNESVQSNKLGVTVNVNPPAAPANLRSISVTP